MFKSPPPPPLLPLPPPVWSSYIYQAKPFRVAALGLNEITNLTVSHVALLRTEFLKKITIRKWWWCWRFEHLPKYCNPSIVLYIKQQTYKLIVHILLQVHSIPAYAFTSRYIPTTQQNLTKLTVQKCETFLNGSLH